jgi:hypothetical protein
MQEIAHNLGHGDLPSRWCAELKKATRTPKIRPDDDTGLLLRLSPAVLGDQ